MPIYMRVEGSKNDKACKWQIDGKNCERIVSVSWGLSRVRGSYPVTDSVDDYRVVDDMIIVKWTDAYSPGFINHISGAEGSTRKFPSVTIYTTSEDGGSKCKAVITNMVVLSYGLQADDDNSTETITVQYERVDFSSIGVTWSAAESAPDNSGMTGGNAEDTLNAFGTRDRGENPRKRAYDTSEDQSNTSSNTPDSHNAKRQARY